MIRSTLTRRAERRAAERERRARESARQAKVYRLTDASRPAGWYGAAR